jgi:S1-C subfamily serine protease
MAEKLASMAGELAGVVEKGGAGVVRVEARRRLPASGIVWSADGVILTSSHVVEREEGITIGLPGGERAAAQLVGRDPGTDIAVLRAEAAGLSVPGLAEPDDLKVGYPVLALARPGEHVQATLGIVSALEEGWRTRPGGTIDRYVQTDVIMYPGFSGGPLVDVASGRVAGMNSSALARGVSVALPVPTLRRVAGALLEHGRMRRGFLGVTAQAVALPAAIAAEVGQESGLMLMSVDADSPAAAGGLIIGDVLITLDGEPVRHLEDLLALLSGDRVGRTATVRVLRGGALHTAAVTIGERR